MANVKSVRIDGSMPFDILERGNERVVRMMAEFSAPSWGLSIRYGDHAWVPNEHGGRTAYYHFTISGSEAVSFAALEEDLKALEAAGATITKKASVDMEA